MQAVQESNSCEHLELLGASSLISSCVFFFIPQADTRSDPDDSVIRVNSCWSFED